MSLLFDLPRGRSVFRMFLVLVLSLIIFLYCQYNHNMYTAMHITTHTARPTPALQLLATPIHARSGPLPTCRTLVMHQASPTCCTTLQLPSAHRMPSKHQTRPTGHITSHCTPPYARMPEACLRAQPCPPFLCRMSLKYQTRPMVHTSCWASNHPQLP